MLDKMMTTKFPLGVVLMELAHQMRRRRAVLRACWIPRLQNEEADRLTNWNFMDFEPNNRIPVELEKLDFAILNEFLEEGEKFIEEVDERRKASAALREAGAWDGTERRRKKLGGRGSGKRLRDTDPWH